MEKDFKNRSALRIFASYYRPHIKLFIIDMLCALFVSVVDLVFPYISRMSMQTYLPEGMFRTFFVVMGIMILAYIIRALLYYVITYWGHDMGVRIEADLREDLFRHIQQLSFGFFDKNRTGQLMSRVTNDLFEITELSHHGPEDLFISAVTLIGAFCILCTIEWRLAVAVFAIVPLFIVFTVIQRGRMRAVNIKVKENTAAINASIESSLSGVRTAKSFTNEDWEYEKFHRSNNDFRASKGSYYKAMGVFHGGMEFAMSIMSVLVVTAGGYFIMRGSMDYVDLVTFALYVSTFITPVRKLSAFVEQFLAGMAGFSRFLQLMRTDPEITDAPDAVELGNVRGEVRFEGVTFAYEGHDEVLRDINVTIPAGSSFAVVGPSGGGKTTLCHLIPRFYDVTEGAVLVDGRDVRTVTQQSLRENIGIVQQDVFLFAGTILENIRYGRPDATDAEVAEAACRAEIHDEIMQMPDGYATYVGERGAMLSGGQKQRVGIARVFIKDPPILILDEATSALDSITEARIQAAFDELSRGRTSIVIAHRLSTVRNADLIAVVDDERVVECGAHEELIALGGRYAELHSAQTL